MREKKWFGGRKIAGLILFLVLMLMNIGVVHAQETGRIELHFPENSRQVEMTLYRVADYADGSFVYDGVFEGCGVSLDGIVEAQDAEQAAQQLSALALDKGASGITQAVGESGVLVFGGLESGYYLLVQTGGLEYLNVQMVLVPIPHMLEDGTLSYEAVIAPKYSVPEGAIILTKTDDDGNAVAGVVFCLEKKEYVSEEGSLPEGVESGQDVGGRYFWKRIREDMTTNEMGELAVMNLPLGTYRFIEISAPEGYVLNSAPHYVSVESAGQVVEVDGIYEIESGEATELEVVNEQTLVLVNKVDENGQPVAGAELVVRSSDGSILYSFVSSEEPYELKRLPAGEYILSEIAAPEGYEVSEDVRFTVDDTYGAVNEVTMTDKKKEETDTSLIVIKDLEDEHGYLIAAKDAVFYVALFEDASFEKRVSDVKEISFKDTYRSAVTFENLENGKTYYIAETDAYGNVIDSMAYEDAVFAPNYLQGNDIMLNAQNAHGEFRFKNVFHSLPKDFYYSGEITIRKEVLRDAKPYETDGVFYAGIFEDEAYTQRYGSVIELDMDGSSEVTVTVPVSIGVLPTGEKNYYIAETDSTGKVLNASDINFTISIDKSEVTLDVERRSEKVTITNSYEKEEEYESETQNPSNPGGSGGSSGGGSVQTGDETPVALVMVLMMMAAAVMIMQTKRRKY